MPAAAASFKSKEALQALFGPQSVAVIGASTAPEKLGYQIFKNILDAGFPGTVYPINPKATEILGRPCYPGIARSPIRSIWSSSLSPRRSWPTPFGNVASGGRKGPS